MARLDDAVVTVRTEYRGGNPIRGLLRSRKVLIALFAVIQALVLEYFNVPDQVWQSIATLAGVLIGAIALEDAAEKYGYGAPSVAPLTQAFTGQLSPIERKHLRRELLNELLELWGEEDDDPNPQPSGGSLNPSGT